MARHLPTTPQTDLPPGVANPYERFVPRQISRSQISNAPYNPRQISPSARKLLRDNLEKVGLVEPLTWNVRTGNLLSGHQRLSILDDLLGKKAGDYHLTVSEVDLDPATEKIQNVHLNNPTSQGTFSKDGMRSLLSDPDFDMTAAGFDNFTFEMEFGLRPGGSISGDIAGLMGTDTTDSADPTDGTSSSPADSNSPIDDPPQTTDSRPTTTIQPPGLFSPADPTLRNSAEALKDRKKEYETTNSADPQQDVDYILVMAFNSRDDKNQYLSHIGLPEDLRYISAADVLEMMRDEFRWR